jgi:hypothetical protein
MSLQFGESWRETMAKPKKLTPEEIAEREKRAKEFRELLERRAIRDAELRAERERRSAS